MAADAPPPAAAPRTAEALTRAVTAALRPAGLDLVQAFDAGTYAPPPGLAPLPLLGRRRALGLVIGNTRALWSPFLRALRVRPDLQQAGDPIDRYVEGIVRACAGRLPCRTGLRFAHQGGPGLVSMLRVAEASGLARIGPAHLAVHPAYGPWFGLRAVIVLDAEPPGAPPAAAPDPCRGCDAPCRTALDRAVQRTEATTQRGIADTWEDWVAVRDACPVGRESRYPDAQLRYHYTKDRAVLDAAGTPGPPEA